MSEGLPSAKDAERSILSVIFQNPEKLDIAVEKGITEHHFIAPSHQNLYRAFLSLTAKGKPIELAGVSQYFKDKGLLENVGGRTYLSSIYTDSATTAYLNNHIRAVIDKYRLRQVIKKCDAASKEAYENPENVDEFLDEIEKDVFSIDRSYNAEDADDLDSLLEGTVSRLEGYIKGEIEVEGLPTRFKVFNDLTKGLRGGDMIIIAARPSMGKTALMCNMVEDLVVAGEPGMIFSCEMTSSQLMDRIFYGRAKLPMHFLRKGFKPTQDELQRLMKATSEIKKKKLFIDDTPAIQIDEVRAKLRRKKKEHDIKYFAADYLQLFRAGRESGREREVADISAGFKSICKELDIPGIILAQLNRSAEKRQGNEPKMSDLRESGAIEQDADIIGLLYRKDYYSEEEMMDVNAKSDAKLIIGKNRNGPTGEVNMKFQKSIMQFR